MADQQYRQNQSFNVDDSIADLDNTADTSQDIASTTMSTTTTTTSTNTRPTPSQQQHSPNGQQPRGSVNGNIYRPQVTMPGMGSGHNSPPNNANATMGAAAAVGEQILQVPVAQPNQHPFYMDQNFLQTMSNMFTQVLDARLAQQPPPVSPIHSEHNQSRPRTSTPNSQDGRTQHRQRESPTNITQNFAGVHASDHPPTFRPILAPARLNPKAPVYIPVAEQAMAIHQNAARSAQNQATLFSGVAEAIQLMARNLPNAPPEMDTIVHNLNQQAASSSREAQSRIAGIQNAQLVTRYYETPIVRPTYPPASNEQPLRVNYRELLMLTGYFDPNDKATDFKHVWQKLVDYGMMNQFQMEQYVQALGSILKNDAYETYVEFRASNKSLDEMLDYFASVYTKKRSLIVDRKAVDEFTRLKGESIVVCMERAVLAIDKLKLLHDPSGWPALRQQMKHNILMQVVKEETKRAVQMEVDYAYEDTGMPYDFDKLIRFADRYERNHNCAPKEDVTTLFKVASGGIHRKEKRSSSQDQLSHLKKEQMLQKKVTSLESELQTLKSNEARLYKNEGRSGSTRDSRRAERDSRSRTDRSKSYDRNRGITTSTPSRSTTPTPSKSPAPTVTYPKPAYSPPDPYKSRTQSRSPDRRGSTPSSQYRRDSSTSRSRDESRSRYRDEPRIRYRDSSQSRYRDSSQNRYRDRSSSNSRYPSSRDSKYPPKQDSRPQSRSGSSNTERITSTGSKTVIITINGQDYAPVKKEN